MFRRRLFFVGTALLALSGNCWGQKASNWRVYKAGDGMPESACVAVCFSPQGKVLTRHLNLPFVCELDGFRVSQLPAPHASKGRVYQSPGGQLWTVAPDGLEEFQSGMWVLHPIAEIARSVQTSMVDPVPLYPIRQDLVLLLLPDRLVEFNSEDPERPRTRRLRSASETRLERFSGMARARNGGLWISGARGLARIPGPLRNLKPETDWTEFLLPESLELNNLQQPFEEGTAEVQPGASLAVTALADCRTNGNKVVAIFDGYDWTAGRPQEQKLRKAWRGPDGSCWAMAIDSLWQWQEDQTEMSECDELSARQYFDVALEPSGAFWLATSDGLFRYAPLLWRTEGAVRKLGSPVRCLTDDQDKRLWFISGGRLYCLSERKLQDYPLPLVNERFPLARALYVLKSGVLTLAVEDPESSSDDLIFRFQPARGIFTQIPSGGGRLKALGLLKDGSLCVQKSTLDETGTGVSLQVYGGRNLEAFPDLPPLEIGSHLRCLFCAQGGDVWVAGDSGTACLRDHKWRSYVSNDKSMPEGGSCFAELPDGKIWCAVEDQVWEFDGRKWSILRRGIERINGLLRAKDGSMWVASNNGLQRYLHDAWVQNGLEDGLPSTTVRDIVENEQGLWAATSRGLSLFHPEADPETDAPQTYIQKLSDLGNTAPEGGSVTLSFTGRDKWKFTARERLLYSYRLDDRDWSVFQERTGITFTDLAPGKHYFQVRAMDRNCNIDPRPAQLEFAVVLPWYKETRLVLIACAGAAAAVFFGGLAFNRHRQLVRSYAEIEKKVAERTQQLEVAGRELLHSQKMNALGTLAAGIAHDFNNILSIIKGSAQIIEDNLQDQEKIKIRADRIRTVVEQGSGIVKAMLGFSRESGALDAACDVNSIVEETLKLLGDRFLREVQVEFKPEPALPSVPGSKDFIQQILLNFIFNAAEAMSGRKLIHVTTRLSDRLPPDLVLAPSAARSFVLITVEDFGCGIAPENLPRIFEPFFTTKALSARRGTGLGLSMAYELAKKLGAGLAVKSVVNQGSIFMLLLPIVEPETKSTL